jgi:putative membrane protein
MRIIISIIINAFILFAMTYLLSENTQMWIKAWITVVWWLKTYILWGIILWIINATIKPILKILSLPLFLIFFWLVSFIINWIILKLFDFIVNKILIIPDISYTIVWFVNFIIAVAIFTILNIVSQLLFSKK